MAESAVSICSNALRRIGANAITALTDNSDAARLCNAFYTPTLRRLLRGHNWNFSLLRVALARLTATPVDLDNRPSTYQFAVPTDPFCEMVLETNLDPQEAWVIETYTSGSTTQRVLITDASAVSILYVGLITDTTLFDDLFSYLFETDLAYQLAYPITRNAQLSGVLKDELREVRQQARSRDGQESRLLRKFNSDDLTKVR